MYYLDLFSGIGGFALGVYWAGWRFDEHYFSDVDDYCNTLYRLRFPHSIPLGDIKGILASSLPQSKNESDRWVVTGGFPCQDISIAGKGEGIGGERSGLWFEMWRIIRDLQPRWVIIENVGAITFRGLSTVLNSLTEIGYDAEWQDIRASDMGAPHKRERIWIVAYPYRQGLSQFKSPRKKQQGWFGLDRLSLPNEWGTSNPSQTFIRRGLPGISHRMDRLKALGNSIVPQIAELLFRRIAEVDENIQIHHSL